MRCNLSSWYVEPAFRGYASLLAARALGHKTATYLNISPAPNTTPIIEAQAGRDTATACSLRCRPCSGAAAGVAVSLVAADRNPDAPCEEFERDLLVRHAAYGCLSFWCVTSERAYPFVFRRRLTRAALPCAR